MPKTVITIDDAATMRKMVSFTLRGAGYSMLEAEDGLAALEVLKGAQVDLIITDVNMPRMDGMNSPAKRARFLRSRKLRFSCSPRKRMSIPRPARKRPARRAGW